MMATMFSQFCDSDCLLFPDTSWNLAPDRIPGHKIEKRFYSEQPTDVHGGKADTKVGLRIAMHLYR